MVLLEFEHARIARLNSELMVNAHYLEIDFAYCVVTTHSI